jgi:hypothetical protein
MYKILNKITKKNQGTRKKKDDIFYFIYNLNKKKYKREIQQIKLLKNLEIIISQRPSILHVRLHLYHAGISQFYIPIFIGERTFVGSSHDFFHDLYLLSKRAMKKNITLYLLNKANQVNLRKKNLHNLF